MLSNKTTNLIAVILLAVMFITGVLSVKDDALTFDELAHLPAGYSYLTQRDYRLNPEHPPLVKDLSALPLLSLDLNFPEEDPSWAEGSQGRWWVQFNFGTEFLYRSGNDADQIIFLAKIPMVFLLILLGWFLFRWAKELGGNRIALLTLILFSFSPTLIAHGRLVTTDVAAAFGVVLATYYYLKFLKEPTKKNIVLAGIALGISLLFKFSLILLFPFFGVITLVCAGLKKPLLKSISKHVFLAIAVIAIAVIFVIWPVYAYHTSNYPPDFQYSEAEAFLETTALPESFIKMNLLLAKNPITRPISQYALGLLMATNRTTTGNTTYFLGTVSAAGWWYYFPVVFFLKVPLPFHILLVISLFGTALLIKKPFWKHPFSRIKAWIENHFTEFAMIIFLVVYWATSILGSLNIGVRHLLPIFPFTYLLVLLGINNWLSNIKKTTFKKVVWGIISLLLVWYTVSSLLVFPHYLTYFNDAVGGGKNGYKYIVDSNLDWGQDLKRLEKWMNEENVDKIYIDHFGGGELEYYLKDRFERWNRSNLPQDFPGGNYIAVSATQLQGGRGMAALDYDQPTDYYMWLNEEELTTVIGNSIFVFYVD